MAHFIKLLNKHKGSIRQIKHQLCIHNPTTCISNSFHTRTLLSSTFKNKRNPTLSKRHNSSTQTQSTTSNNVTTCTNDSRPPSLRGVDRIDLSTKYTVGDIVDGDFTVTKIIPIPSYECTAYQFVHNGTGAIYFHLDTADTNNAFSVSLRTLPSDSTGVAHILEHTVLCGSRNYPVRDPFFHMLKRSLNTFMNAMTSADWTAYPFATQNEQDYHNLMSVYLDAIFFPNLNKLDFMQEGHRFEFEEMKNDGTDLMYKGVVYNEMKGNMSDPNDIFAYNLQKHLFPDNLYQHNFGGNPPEIPQLTHENLVDFHRKFYHPSNASFYSYGDLAPPLAEINEFILCKFSRLDTCDIEASISTKQDLYSEAQEFTAFIPEDAIIADPHQQHKVCMSWICNEVSNFEDTFGLTVLSQLLLHGPNSPFYNSLIKPNIGYGYASATGYTMDAVQGSFSVGLNNIKDEDIVKVEKIILRTLSECVEKGFSSERIEAVLHQFEIDQKHRSGTFGLNLLFRMMSLITHRVETPIKALQIDELLDNIRAKVLGENASDPQYFEHLIEKYMINNTHRVTLKMKPDKEYMNKLEEEEKERLSQIQTTLDDAAKREIVEESVALAQYQETNSTNVDVLPSLKVSDIPLMAPEATYVDTKPVEYDVYNELNDEHSRITTQSMSTRTITNELSYYKLLYDLEGLFPPSSKGMIEDNDYHLVLPLYASCIASMGATDLDYKQLSQLIESKTGGVSSEIHALTALNDAEDKLRYVFEVNSFGLNRNLDSMLSILEDVLLHPNYEYYERLETIIKDKVQSDITHLIEAGHSYAISHAASAFGRYLPATKINEKLEGISQILFAGQLSNSLQGQRYATLKELIAIFYDISYQLFKQQGPIKSLLVSDKEEAEINREQLMQPFAPLDYYNHPAVFEPLRKDVIQSDLPKPVFARRYSVLEPLFNSANKFVDKKYKEQQDKSSSENYAAISMLRNYFAIPSQVNYVAGVIPTVAYNHEDCASLRVIAKILSLNYLHQEIREKNGAYGGGAAQNKNIFAFFSYRDPNAFKTTQTFQQSVDWIQKNENVCGKDIDEALLSLFGNLDSPKAPQQKGYQEFLQNIDENMRQTHREQLLAVNKESIRDAVDKYLVKAFEENEVAFTIVGKQEIEQTEKEQLEENRFKFVTLG